MCNWFVKRFCFCLFGIDVNLLVVFGCFGEGIDLVLVDGDLVVVV